MNSVKQSNGIINDSLNILNGLDFSIPNVYTVVVRSDDKNALMCSDCGCKDMDEQIKSLVKEFCHGFDFSNPRQRDVENLLCDDSFVRRIPKEYRYNVKGFEDGKCICTICLEDQEENKVDVFKAESYYVCINCGSLFHKECTEEWARKNFSCPSCRNKIGVIFHNSNNVAEGQKSVFRMWVNNGCSMLSLSDMLEGYRNMNEADFEKIGETCFKFQDKLKNGEMPDEFLELILPKKVAPKSKCARFCDCLRSFFGC